MVWRAVRTATKRTRKWGYGAFCRSVWLASAFRRYMSCGHASHRDAFMNRFAYSDSASCRGRAASARVIRSTLENSTNRSVSPDLAASAARSVRRTQRNPFDSIERNFSTFLQPMLFDSPFAFVCYSVRFD